MESLRQFVKHCMLFQTKEFINIVFGIVGWLSFFAFAYAVYNLIMLET
ncbi:MAG: hypothetical protein QY309_01780 [Cyclobacteriaceae bacterium]|jgi:hypothetical protein|nr:MAG: hypothetical protein QY309_01780 [Cyclobacteriaceae bacterium]